MLAQYAGIDGFVQELPEGAGLVEDRMEVRKSDVFGANRHDNIHVRMQIWWPEMREGEIMDWLTKLAGKFTDGWMSALSR